MLQTSWIFSCTVSETVLTSKIMNLIWNWQNTNHLGQKEFISWATLTYSTSGARVDVLFLITIFRLYPGLKMSFEHKSVRKNLFLSAFFFWDSRLSLREMDQESKFGGTIGYGDSYLEFLFLHFKVFRLHAIQQDASGSVRGHSGKGPGYCYRIGRGPNSCLLGHVTGLLFCLYVKLFLPSIFNSFDFWTSMSCIVLDFEVADENVVKELGVFIDGKVHGYPFRPPKKTNPNTQNNRFGAQETCAELCGTVNVWVTVSFQTFFLEL